LKVERDGELHPVISDFGLSRHTQVYITNNAFGPYKWMPPEFMSANTFEEGSDVWSWALFTNLWFENDAVSSASQSCRASLRFILPPNRLWPYLSHFDYDGRNYLFCILAKKSSPVML
jgi:serine/threonine protein kinase